MTDQNQLTLERVPIEKIDLGKETNPRQYSGTDDESIKELAEDIEQNGLAQNPLLRPYPEEKDNPEGFEYELIFGYRRILAYKHLGREEVEAKVREYTNIQTEELRLAENLHRSDLHFWEVYLYVSKMAEEGVSLATLAKRLNKKKTYVKKLLSLRTLTEQMRAKVQLGQMDFNLAAKVAALPQPVQDRVSAAFKQYGEDGAEYFDKAAFTQILKQENTRIEDAPFSPEDSLLRPDAGACIGCKFHSKGDDSQGSLFDDVTKESFCLNKVCYDLKIEAYWLRLVESAKKESGSDFVYLAAADHNVKEPKLPKGSEVPAMLGVYDYRVKQEGEVCSQCLTAVLMEANGEYKVVNICPTRYGAEKFREEDRVCGIINSASEADLEKDETEFENYKATPAPSPTPPEYVEVNEKEDALYKAKVSIVTRKADKCEENVEVNTTDADSILFLLFKLAALSKNDLFPFSRFSEMESKYRDIVAKTNLELAEALPEFTPDNLADYLDAFDEVLPEETMYGRSMLLKDFSLYANLNPLLFSPGERYAVIDVLGESFDIEQTDLEEEAEKEVSHDDN